MNWIVCILGYQCHSRALRRAYVERHRLLATCTRSRAFDQAVREVCRPSIENAQRLHDRKAELFFKSAHLIGSASMNSQAQRPAGQWGQVQGKKAREFRRFRGVTRARLANTGIADISVLLCARRSGGACTDRAERTNSSIKLSPEPAPFLGLFAQFL